MVSRQRQHGQYLLHSALFLLLLVVAGHGVHAASEVHNRGMSETARHAAVLSELMSMAKSMGSEKFARATLLEGEYPGYTPLTLSSDLLAQLMALPGAAEFHARVRDHGFSYPGEENAEEFGYVNHDYAPEEEDSNVSSSSEEFLGTESTVESTHHPAHPQDRRDSVAVMKALGKPKDQHFHAHGVYFRRLPAGLWEYGSGKTGPWHPTSHPEHAPASARPFIQRVHDVNPVPRASIDVLEILGPADGYGVRTYDAGISATPLYYKYVGGGSWKWSPHHSGPWMPTSTHVVSSGKYQGQKPVQENRDIIDALEVYTLTGKGNLPANFGETWLVKTVREAWRKVNQETLAHVVNLKNNLKKVVTMVGDLNLGGFKVSELSASLAEHGPHGALFAILGFLDGVFLGMVDHITHALHDEGCDMGGYFTEIKTAAMKTGHAIKTLLLEVGHVHKIVGNANAVWDCMLDLMNALLHLNQYCESLAHTLTPMFIMLGVGIVLTLAISATGYGAVFKVGMALISLVMAGPFLIKSVKRVIEAGQHVLHASTPEKVAEMSMHLIEHMSRVVGVVYGIIVLTKEVLHEGPHAVSKLLNSKVGRSILSKFGTTPTGVTGKWNTFASKFKSFRGGNTAAAKDIVPHGTEHGHGGLSGAWHKTMEKGHTTHILEGAAKAASGNSGHH
eukprot:TRINITY_DN23996_c0_g1_i1.p1 TRINITY_DN23996_c0_g1~~TRINITY_DN23996_c0_g1_i1.p1  ORF type:complete len:675 (-),score=181.65 TRINITY_DN23996_c0_g1_i1:220-2244(-)